MARQTTALLDGDPAGDQTPHQLARRSDRQGLLLLANTAATTGLGVVYWGVAARSLPMALMGAGTALVAAITTLSNFSQLNFYSSVGVLLPRMGDGKARAVARIYGVTSFLTLLAAAIVAVFIPRLLQHGDDRSAQSSSWIVAMAVIWTIFALQDGVLIAIGAAKIVLLSNTVYGVVKLGLLVWAAAMLPAQAIALSWYGPLGFIVIAVNIWIWRELRRQRALPAPPPPETPTAVRRLPRFVAIDYLGFVVLQCVTTALPVYVSLLSGPEDAAVFATCWMVASGVDLIAYNLTSSMAVGIAQDPSATGHLVRRLVPRMAALLLPAVVGGVALAPWFLAVFGSQYADDGAGILRLLLIGCIPRAVVTAGSAICRALMHPGRVLAMQLTLALVVVAIGLPLLQHFGLTALATVWIAGQSSAAVVATALCVSLLRRRPARTGGTPSASSPSSVASPAA
ncbi:MAG TPA: hypothetical protein VFO77_10905 [Actinoplanes sp.]|nr:hypothetical protein [Actinoplanes sp.]